MTNCKALAEQSFCADLMLHNQLNWRNSLGAGLGLYTELALGVVDRFIGVIVGCDHQLRE